MNTSKQNDFSINYSSHPISYDYPVRDSLYIVIPLTVIYSLIFLTGMVGNVITCVVISRNKSMHTATNYYLFSLAVSDLLLLLSGKTKQFPLETHQSHNRVCSTLPNKKFNLTYKQILKVDAHFKFVYPNKYKDYRKSYQARQYVWVEVFL